MNNGSLVDAFKVLRVLCTVDEYLNSIIKERLRK